MGWAGGGYLARLSPSVFQERHAHHLPESMTGAQFEQLYGSHCDPATRITPGARSANTA